MLNRIVFSWVTKMAGMEAFFFHPEVYDELYSCSAYNVSDVPLEMRQHILLGQAFIFISLVYEVIVGEEGP